MVRQVTAKDRYARALAAVTDWCLQHRHLPIPEQHTHLVAKMRGHYALLRHIRQLSAMSTLVRRKGKKDLAEMVVAAGKASRSSWSRFNALLTRHPLPAARIVHRYTAVSEALP